MKKSPAACVVCGAGERAFFRSALEGFRLRFYPCAAAFLKTGPKGLAVICEPLPDMSGRDLVAVLRGGKRPVGLLVLTGPGPYSPSAAALCLENGADEYFSFPPEPRLFRARLLNLLGRPPAGPRRADEKPAEFRFGALKISPEARTARIGADRVKLTALEFDLLLYFLRNQGRVVSRTVLLEQVWKQGAETGTRAVDKRVETLRTRLGSRFGAKLKTVFGLGYIFNLKPAVKDGFHR